MRKPRALRPGDRIAVVAPASAFVRTEFDAGVHELRLLGFEPVYEESVFERRAYAAGSAAVRAAAFERAWRDPDIAALIAVRGGYGSVHLLPLLGDSLLLGEPKAFIGFSDNTSPVGATAFAIPPDFTVDFSSRNLPSELTVCNSVCSPELVFDEGRAIVSSMFPEIGVSSRVYYTAGERDKDLLSITDSKVVAFGKGNRGD